MILKEMTIQNFKGIKEPLKIKFKPISLLFGQNSAGKSSIIQAINYAREIFISGGNVNPDRQTKDNIIGNLGSYRNITNNHDITKPIIFEFLLDYHGKRTSNFISKDINSELSSQNYSFLDRIIPNRNVIDRAGTSPGEIRDTIDTITSVVLKIGIVWNELLRQPEIKKILVKANDSPLYDVVFIQDLNKSEIVKQFSFYKHPILPKSIEKSLRNEDGYILNMEYFAIIDNDYLYSLNDKEKERNQYLEKCQKEHEEKWGTFEEEQQDIRKNKTPNDVLFELQSINRLNVPLFDSLKDCGWHDWGVSDNKNFHQNLLAAFVTTPIKTLEHVFNNDFKHIGPLREIPPRDYRPIKYPESFCWTAGLAAYDVLVHQSTTQNFIKELNKWLVDKDYLNTGYYIELKRYSLVDDQSLLWKFIEGAEDIGDIDKIKDAIKTALMQDRKTEFKIKDKNSNIELLLQDVGTGISQILPIVVGALWLENKVITIEQPELHIHPAMQSEMGDLLIRSAKHNGDNNNFFIVETHSEHLMLRILRRIRETTDDENDKKLYLSPDDVAVYYIKSGENGVKATHISVNEDGRFDSPWPDGFFAERSKELF